MSNFRIRGSKTGTQIIQRIGEVAIRHIDVPDKKLRGVGQALIDLADAKDAIKHINFSVTLTEAKP
jgi:hypothetical protein